MMKKFIIHWIITCFLGSFFYSLYYIETLKNTSFTIDLKILPLFLFIYTIISLPCIIFIAFFHKKSNIIAMNIYALLFIVIELIFFSCLFYSFHRIFMFFICYHIIKFLGLNLIIRE